MYEISIIMPCYKGEDFIEKSIHTVERIVSNFSKSFEIIVVIDGFVDKTYEKAKRLENVYKNLKVIGYKRNIGKGFAIKYGFKYASGKYVLFFDSDLEIHPECVKIGLNYIKKGYDIAIASKRHRFSRIEYSRFRRFLSLCYNIFLRCLFNISLRDTQTGLKIFRKEILNSILSRSIIRKYAFDVELLVLANKMKYRIIEFPVIIKSNRKGFPMREVFYILRDTLIIAYRLYFKKYD